MDTALASLITELGLNGDGNLNPPWAKHPVERQSTILPLQRSVSAGWAFNARVTKQIESEWVNDGHQIAKRTQTGNRL